MVDQAGGGPVHHLGAVTGLVATLMLKPRLGRFKGSEVKGRMACPTNALLGMFLLWLEHISYCVKGTRSCINYGGKSIDCVLITTCNIGSYYCCRPACVGQCCSTDEQ